MKKYLIIVLLCLLPFISCSTPTESPSNNDPVPVTEASGSIEGGLYKVMSMKGKVNGIDVVNVTYTEKVNNVVHSFMIEKQSANGNDIFKGSIEVQRKNIAFKDGYWDKYSVMNVTDPLLMENVISGAAQKDGIYNFVMVGSYTKDKINKMKSATAISVRLISSSDPARNITFQIQPEFYAALLKYF